MPTNPVTARAPGTRMGTSSLQPSLSGAAELVGRAGGGKVLPRGSAAHGLAVAREAGRTRGSLSDSGASPSLVQQLPPPALPCLRATPGSDPGVRTARAGGHAARMHQPFPPSDRSHGILHPSATEFSIPLTNASSVPARGRSPVAARELLRLALSGFSEFLTGFSGWFSEQRANKL